MLPYTGVSFILGHGLPSVLYRSCNWTNANFLSNGLWNCRPQDVNHLDKIRLGAHINKWSHHWLNKKPLFEPTMDEFPLEPWKQIQSFCRSIHEWMLIICMMVLTLFYFRMGQVQRPTQWISILFLGNKNWWQNVHDFYFKTMLW